MVISAMLSLLNSLTSAARSAFFCLADSSVLASLLKSIVNHRQTPLFLSHIVHLLCNMFNMPKFTHYYEHVFIINAIKLFVNALFR